MMFDEPTFLIQFGYNGQTLVERAFDGDHADGVILSPTDYEYNKNQNLARRVNQWGGTVLFDPQFYIPRTERAAADTYPYFEEKGGDNFETVVVSEKKSRQELCRQIIDVQDTIDVDAYITPARYLDTFSDRKIEGWVRLTKTFLEVAEEEGRDIPVFASLPISGASLNEQDPRDKLLDRITSVTPDGFYVSVEYDRYRQHPLFGASEVYSYLDLLKNLRYNHFDIVLGHTHQIAHLALGLGINAFASGHYKNTRAFDTDRWIPEDSGFGGGSVFYYYTDELLADLRVEQDLQVLYASPGFDIDRIRMYSPYENDLFGSTSPEEAEWKAAGAEWDHWVWSCYQMSRKYRDKSLRERIETTESVLENASDLYDEIKTDVSPLDSVEEDIYADWETAFDSVRSEADIREIERVLARI